MNNSNLAPQNNTALQKEADRLAEQLYEGNTRKRASFTSRLLDICARAKDVDFLLIHNPGGFGSTPIEELLLWERSVVDGINNTIGRLGYKSLLTQHLRSDRGWWSHMQDMKDQTCFFLNSKSYKVKVLVAELRFLTRHLQALNVILIGASQGAAFSNAVMRQLDELNRVYSIELGIFFPHMSRRVITKRTLAVDSNGIMPDPMAHRNLWIGFKAYLTAPWRWIKYRLEGKPQKFTYCINAPGHDYNWEYPEVQGKIVDFLSLNFGDKSNVEVEVS